MDVKEENRLFNSLRDKYYNLRNKEFYDGLTFEQRFEIGNSLRDELLKNGYYQYRREMDAFHNGIHKGENTNGKLKVNLASNDYLNFSQHPDIISAGLGFMEELGIGSGSVPMFAGTFNIHKELEYRLAKFTGYPSCITFNSGYSANYGLLTTILTSRDVAILDTQVHASIVDGCCNTNILFFSHNDAASLKNALIKSARYQNKLIIVDGIYSMDGDLAELKTIIDVAKNNNAFVLVDESHAIGVMGKQGKGTQDHLGLADKADFTTGSLGKAMGAVGGYVTGPEGLVSLLELTCRSFIFSASLPPSIAGSLVKGIDLLEDDTIQLSCLWENIGYFKSALVQLGFDTGNSASAIIPLKIRNDEKIMRLTKVLFDAGIFVNPVYYPVVPKRKSMIRLSMSSAFNQFQMDYALGQLEVQGKIIGII